MHPYIQMPFVRVSVSVYHVFRLIAIIACVALALRFNRRQGYKYHLMASVYIVSIPLGILGARALDMVEYGEWYPSFAGALVRNGSSIYGAFMAAMFAVLVVLSSVGIPPLPFLDGAAPSLALGEAITRIGCFCAGCCYGVPFSGPWGVTFPPGSFAFQDLRAQGLLRPTMVRTMPLHPVQLYAVGIMLAVTVALIRRLGRRSYEGEIFALFLIAYGSERLLLAPFRMEALASMKVFSCLFIAAGCGLLAGGAWRSANTSGRFRACVSRST